MYCRVQPRVQDVSVATADGWMVVADDSAASRHDAFSAVVRLFIHSLLSFFVTTNHERANFVCTNEKRFSRIPQGVMGVTHGRQPSCSPRPPLRLPRTELSINKLSSLETYRVPASVMLAVYSKWDSKWNG